MIKKWVWIASFLITLSFIKSVYAAGSDLQYSFVGEAVRDALVSGDVQKYRAQHWMDNNYVGGVQDATFHDKIGKDITIDMSGHALIDENDFAGNITIRKKNLGYALFDYTEFRKYYDPTGGVYHPFTTLKFSNGPEDEHVDIGHVRVETGLEVENWPKIVAAYERTFKEGTKSMVNWAPEFGNTITGASGWTRNIGPAWMHVDEKVDSFTLNESHTIKGYEIKGEQRFEVMTSPTDRPEHFLDSTTSTANTNNKIRDQQLSPISHLFFSTFSVEKWFLNDKVMASSAYRFYHLTSQEVENIFETDVNGNVTNSYSSPKQVRNALANNRYNANTWVGNIMMLPKSWFSITTKFKGEAIGNYGNSTYPTDTLPSGGPDGTIDSNFGTDRGNKIGRFGQEISIRYTQIPRTALYTDLGLEEIRNWLSENRVQLLTGVNNFFRETITDSFRANWDLGLQTSPVKHVYITSQVRRSASKNNFNNKNTVVLNPDDEAFFDMFNTATTQFTTRISWKPNRYFQPSFRYQFRKDIYSSVFPISSTPDLVEQTSTKANIFSLELSSQLKDWLLATFSMSRRYAFTYTPASGAPFTPSSPAGSPTTTIPGFKDNSDTYMLNLDYFFNDKVTFNTAVYYSRAANFDDFSNSGLPLGAQFNHIDLMAGLQWIINKHLTVGPKYVFYHYNVDPNTSEVGNYNAHLIWFDVSIH